MTFYWIYDLSTWSLVLLFVVVGVAFTWTGTIFVRPFLRAFVRRQSNVNDIIGYLLGAHGTYFGILVGLLALAAYQNYTQADALVTTEAAKLAALYRDVSSYPEPLRGELQRQLRAFTEYVLTEAWDEQKKGQIPKRGTGMLWEFQKHLNQFEPMTKGQEILHQEAMREFNSFVETKQLRLNVVNAGIPGILWYVVIIGAVVNVVLIWLLDMRFVPHLVLGGIAAFFLSTLIALIAAMDNPFRGEVCVPPDAFQIVYDRLMKPTAAGGPTGGTP
jgi:hypothetical protein